MRNAEETGKNKYVFGFEESYGCLIGDYARDKDGIAAVMALCEAACYAKSQDKTLWDMMQDIYKKYGYYKETQVSIVREGAEGAQEIQDMMTKTRQKDITEIAGLKVLKFKDIQKDIEKNMKNGISILQGRLNLITPLLSASDSMCLIALSYDGIPNKK